MPFLASSQTRTGTADGGFPLYVPNSGNSIAGVSSLNGQAGVVVIGSSDSSIDVTAGAGSVNVSTTGRAIAPSTVTASGAISGASVASAGAVSGATVTASGAVSGASFDNTTADVVTFTTPTYAYPTPPADATQIFDGNVHAQTATTFSVSALANYKSLSVSFSGGSLNNNASGGSQANATLYLCGLAAVPAVGQAIDTNVYVPITMPSQYTQLTLSTSSVLPLNVTPVAGFNTQQLNSIVIPYPSSGTLTVWDFCSAGATRTWLSALTITVKGIL